MRHFELWFSAYSYRQSLSLNLDKSRGAICIVPKPIVEKLGNPKKIKFMIRGKNIVVTND